jgi:hypothetical protein
MLLDVAKIVARREPRRCEAGEIRKKFTPPLAERRMDLEAHGFCLQQMTKD